MSVQSPQPPEPLTPDNSLAARLEEMRAARWAVEDIASDIGRQIDLLMRRFFMSAGPIDTIHWVTDKATGKFYGYVGAAARGTVRCGARN